MCDCEPGYLCHDCAGTSQDPAFHDAMHDRDDPYEFEPSSPAEYEVVE